MSEITSLLASIWSFFTEVDVPLLGISFAALYLGVFIVSISLTLLSPLLGIGQYGGSILYRNARSRWRSDQARRRKYEDERLYFLASEAGREYR